ncbi:MAG: hypothetical protein AAGA60_13860 [Cyanobacteria bacterium P01_E01_bin.42]
MKDIPKEIAAMVISLMLVVIFFRSTDFESNVFLAIWGLFNFARHSILLITNYQWRRKSDVNKVMRKYVAELGLPLSLLLLCLGLLQINGSFENPIFFLHFNKKNEIEIWLSWILISVFSIYNLFWLLYRDGFHCLLLLDRSENTLEAWRNYQKKIQSSRRKILFDYLLNLFSAFICLTVIFYLFEMRDEIRQYINSILLWI